MSTKKLNVEMRKAIVVGCMVLLSAYGYPQNVGIGTTAPTSRLHVVGGSQIIENPLNTTTFLTLRSGTNNGLIIETSSNGSLTTSRLRPLQGGGAGGGITINQSSFVGIGLTTDLPQYLLQVHSTLSSVPSGIAFTNNSLGAAPDNGMKVGLQYPANAADRYGFISLPANMPFNIWQGNTMRFGIQANGYIGIGASIAEARLHVRDDRNGGTALLVENRHLGGSVPISLQTIVQDGLGVAIDARAEANDGTAAPVEILGTAIRAAAASNRNAIGAYATNGTALRASASDFAGYALHTTGRVKFEGIGSTVNGRVLMTDNEGNARWAELPPTPVPTQIANEVSSLVLNNGGTSTFTGDHFFIRQREAAPPVFNPNISDGRYFLYNGNRGALRAGQFFFSHLRHDSIGDFSMALGQRVLAKNINSIALGTDARSVANMAHAYGNFVEAQSFREMVLGSYNNNENYTVQSTTSWNNNDRLLVVGNGANNNSRSNAMVMLKSGNVGVGIDQPVARLHVQSRLVIERPSGGSGNTASIEWRSDGNYRGGMGWDASTGRFFFFDGESGTNTMFINNGRLGIQRDPTTNTLEVAGNASKSSAGDWIANSDERLKKHIAPLQNPLEKLLRLQGVTYEWNDTQTGTNRPSGTHMGFTAQNIQQVFPELVTTDAQGFLQTAYGTYDALYVEAIKALKAEIELLRKELELLKTRNQKQ